MTKKFHVTDGNLLHHDHRHPFQPNAHQLDHPESSGVLPTNPPSSGFFSDDQSIVNSDLILAVGPRHQESIEYVPPEISENNHQDSDVRFFFLT